MSSDIGVVEIEPMAIRHLRRVLLIEGKTQKHGWSLGLFLAELRRPTSRKYLVAKIDGEIVGFAGMIQSFNEGHIVTISTHPAWQKHGVATKLVCELFCWARSVGIDACTLEVRASNVAAIGLYRLFGFAPVGVRPKYYQDPVEDAMILWVYDIGSEEHVRRVEKLLLRVDTKNVR